MIANLLKKVPIIGHKLSAIYQRALGRPVFFNSKQYWEERYKKGGNSGDGSYSQLSDFKADIINTFIKENNIKSIVEFGCGDGNQLKKFQIEHYTGFDVSETIIHHCKNLFKTDSTKEFYLNHAYNNQKADATLSLDVIYHLIEDSVFEDYMKLLFSASDRFVIIYSSNHVQNKKSMIADHVKSRKFTDWIELNIPDFKLFKHIPNKYPFNGNSKVSSLADFYIFIRANT